VTITRREPGSLQSILVQDQRHLRTGRHPVTNYLHVLRRNLVFFESGVARIIDRENLGVNRITLRVTNAPRLLDTNLHNADSKDMSNISAHSGTR
jgi:hypothetical protein